MPYASENAVSRDELPGGVEITEDQYQQAIAALVAGQHVTIEGGFAIIDPPVVPDPEPEPVEPPTLEQIKAAKLAEINEAAESEIAVLSGKHTYPPTEVDTWPTQQAEAAAWFAADEADRVASLVPWCATAAAARGLDLGEFMVRVQAKVEAFMQISALIFGHRQGLEDQIVAATDEADLNAIEWVDPIQLGE